MSLHQVIYTSCRRGIRGVNDGQQIFSYDAGFQDVNNDEVRNLFSYQTPATDPGVFMTEEIALTMPKSFIYRKLSDGTCAFALNTYLGRDYMGSGGRFGNHLSHVVITDQENIINYPCEFYGSNMLRDHMEYDEVNNPDPPDFLPEPVLERAFRIDIDTVIDFLSIEERIEILKNMIYAFFSFHKERKRLVICDEAENIIMWIAALQYLLPLKIARNMSFSTYDYDPSLSFSQICGVVPKGTRYTKESRNHHFVFDLYEKDCPEFEKDEYFFDFIDTSMSFSYDSLQDFHQFIISGYSYNQADEKMYAAYRLYAMMCDGIQGLTEEQIKVALDFAGEYAVFQEETRIIQFLFGQKEELLSIDGSSFLRIIYYIISKYEKLSELERTLLKDLMAEKVLYELEQYENDEKQFEVFYNEIDRLCKSKEFGIVTELMRKERLEKFFRSTERDITAWKIGFIVKSVSTFVIENRVPVEELSLEYSTGQIYYGFVQAIFSKNRQNFFYLISRILDAFSGDCNYLINMALNLEGMLLDLFDPKDAVDSMWSYFDGLMFKCHMSDLALAYSVFLKYRRYERIYSLYSLAILNAVGLSETSRLFEEHYHSFVETDNEYSCEFGAQVLEDFYMKLEKENGDTAYQAKRNLFRLLFSDQKSVSFSDKIIEDVSRHLPLRSPGKEDAELIQQVVGYLTEVLHEPLGGKTLLLVIGIALENCKTMKEWEREMKKFGGLCDNVKPDLSKYTDPSIESYFDWILPKVCLIANNSVEMEYFYNLFLMSGKASICFFTTCTDVFLKQAKLEKDYSVFSEFLGLVFKKGNEEIRKSIGEILCKMGKTKLLDLDELIRSDYKDEKNALRQWEEIMEIAESTNPILNNLSNLFKKKKN